MPLRTAGDLTPPWTHNGCGWLPNAGEPRVRPLHDGWVRAYRIRPTMRLYNIYTIDAIYYLVCCILYML